MRLKGIRILKVWSKVSECAIQKIPKIGKEKSLFFNLAYRLGNNINLSSSINYSRLENLDNNKAIYDGYISRLSFRYQFNNDLSIRLVSEYNKFNDSFLFQPLLKWNPNPSTIFTLVGFKIQLTILI